MKLTGQALARFLAAPADAVAAILLHGPDEGLVKERSLVLAKALLGKDLDDPFLSAVLDAEALKDDPARLPDEAAQLSLLGGRRVVRVRGADDRLAKPLAQVLEAPPGGALVILEAGDLGAGSALRKLVEPAANAATVACYPDGPEELGRMIREAAREHGVRLADDALAYLVESLGGDRLMTRAEIEKLMLFAGPGGSVSAEDAVAAVGDSSALAVEDAVAHAFAGEAASVEAVLGRLFREGESPVRLIRAAQLHVQRLHLAGARIEGGERIEQALRGFRLNFRTEPRFRAQLNRWDMRRAAAALALLTQAELDCKSTGYPDETICRQALASVARLALRAAKRG